MRIFPVELQKRKGKKPIAMVTAYSYYQAQLAEAAGIDALLVGDSLGMVMQGCENTLQVTLEEMIYHTRCVVRGSEKAVVVADMPFMSYQVSSEQAVENAGKLVQQSNCSAVKLEGGVPFVPHVQKIIQAGIPVLGHLGLTPQSVLQLGGFKVQGKQEKQAEWLVESAQALEAAGVFGIVLECVPSILAQKISNSLQVPTIGIGAGSHCDGQVLVWHDLLAYHEKPFKFVKHFANVGQIIKDGLAEYKHAVENRLFPEDKHSF